MTCAIEHVRLLKAVPHGICGWISVILMYGRSCNADLAAYKYSLPHHTSYGHLHQKLPFICHSNAACTHTHSLNLYLHCQLHGPATYDLCHKNTPLPAYCPCRSAAATQLCRHKIANQCLCWSSSGGSSGAGAAPLAAAVPAMGERLDRTSAPSSAPLQNTSSTMPAQMPGSCQPCTHASHA